MTDHKSILLQMQQLLQHIKKLSAFAYSETNAFALTLLNRKRLQLEDEITLQSVNIVPPQYIHKNRTLKAILLCYHPRIKRKLKTIDRNLEIYYKEGISGLQNEVEALIIFLKSGRLKTQINNL